MTTPHTAQNTAQSTTDTEVVPPGRRFPASDEFPTGPAVGEPLPDFTLSDQRGQAVSLSEAMAGQRAVVFFHRSAAWCPYCRTHLVSFQKHLDEFQAAGVQVFAISNDPVEVLAAFAEEQGVTYPLLSDPGSEVIRQYGILNTLIAPEEDRYGIAYPGIYVTDQSGVVVEKMFHREYAVRESAAGILRHILGADFDIHDNPRAEIEGPSVRVSAALAEPQLTFMQRTPLLVSLDLDPGLHLYGQPVPDGFVATEVTVTAPEGVRVGETEAPPTRPFSVEGVRQEFRIFEGAVEFVVPITSELREEPTVTLEVTVRYQACDERQCYLPQSRTLSLTVPLGGLNRPRPRT